MEKRKPRTVVGEAKTMGYLPSEGSSLAECKEAYDRHYNSGGASYKRREQQAVIRKLATTAGWTAGMSILDVGCGIGFQTQILSRQGFRVTGIDFSPSAISLSAKRPGPTYILQDATSYKPENPFDGILFNDFSLFHYELNGVNRLGVDMEAFIERIFSWLAPGGSILIKAPTNIKGIDSNTVVDFASALHPHAGRLNHTSNSHTIVITAKSKQTESESKPEPEPEPEPEPKPEPDSGDTTDPPTESNEPDDDDESPSGHGMGYPDPWGYGHKN